MPFTEFLHGRLGTDWVVALRVTPALRAKYGFVLSPTRYDALEEEWARLFPEEFRAQFEATHSRDTMLLRAAGLWPAARQAEAA